jgi:hypothetical protein
MDLRVNMTSTASHYAEQSTVILVTNQMWKARLCGEIRLWHHRQVLCRHSGDDCPVLGAERKNWSLVSIIVPITVSYLTSILLRT